jgi:hypothetical protein
MESKISCWACALRQAGGMTFLGLCRIFERNGGKAKEIPPTRVDIGCSFFEEKVEEKS